MSRFLLPSMLLSIVLFAGCATSPKIIGKWEVQPSDIFNEVNAVQFFKDGTVLVMAPDNQEAFLLKWSNTGDEIVVSFYDDMSFLVIQPERNTMIWKPQEEDDDSEVVVLRRTRQ